MKAATILFCEMTPPAQRIQDIGALIPASGVPGLHSVRSYIGPESHYLFVYEIDSAFADAARDRVLQSDSATGFIGACDAYTELCTTGDAHPSAIDTPLIYTTRFNVPEDWLAEFDAWCERELAPILLQCPQWRAIRLFALATTGAGQFNRLAVHYLDDLQAFDSPMRAASRATPWRGRLAAQSWFNAHSILYTAREPRRQ